MPLNQKVIPLIDFSNQCNNNCCCLKTKNESRQYKNVMDVFDAIKHLGWNILALKGVDYQILQKDHELYQKASAYHNRLLLKGSGRIWSDEKNVQEIFSLELIAGFDICVYSHKAEIQDRNSGVSGSAKQMLLGIKNILKYRLQSCNEFLVNASIQVNSTNIHSFTSTIKVLHHLGITSFRIEIDSYFFRDEANGENEIQKQLFLKINEAYDYCAKHNIKIWTDDFPVCLHGITNLYFHDYYQIIECKSHQALLLTTHACYEFVDICNVCAFQYFCKGIPEQITVKVQDVISPIAQRVENSLEMRSCNSMDTRQDDIALLLKSQMSKNEKQMLGIKHRKFWKFHVIANMVTHDQVYSQTDSQPLTNFVSQLKQWEFNGLYFNACIETPFQKTEEIIKEHIGKLKGRVLDVGPGKSFYLDLLAPLIGNRTIQYFAIEPDMASAQSLKASSLPMHIWNCNFEESSFKRNMFDHILILRSWNHLKDIAHSCKLLQKYLHDDGKILICENLPFIHLRDNFQIYESQPNGSVEILQHYRNHYCSQAYTLLQRYFPCDSVQILFDDIKSNHWIIQIG